jgi:hypothetical protein
MGLSLGPPGKEKPDGIMVIIAVVSFTVALLLLIIILAILVPPFNLVSDIGLAPILLSSLIAAY